MRVIIRFSLNKDVGSPLRNTLKPILEAQGIMWTNKMTGTYEGYDSPKKIRLALARFWKAVADAQAVGKVRIDHFWMYTDRKTAPVVEE